MLASGSISMAVAEGGRWRTTADLLIDRIRLQYFHDTTRLFYNYASYGFGVELRRGFSSFASQVYPILALYQYGEAFECGWAIRLANSAAERLIALQGPRGEWPWFYYVPGGQIVDFYDVYSVHQHGMAPAFLHHAMAHGVENAREAMIKGFQWLFGANELGTSMLRPAEHLFYRSQLRQGELRTALPRVARSMFNGLSGQSDTIGNYKRLVLRKECRSYELAWILWSFGGRTDYPELTDREEFQVERLPSSMPVSQV